MHLKSLTLKGFKSFASATTLRLESGITCVVGPNGSGKSNVVDAISWVLGEQGAKALRGGKMEDVIFAGTSGRAPLGRAEVTLTIDNSDGALPIDYTEVSITRRMFRDGAGEYEINGAHCRLLDIQELLSDSGIGREMHVVVGQGQLDSVLASKPEDRRAYIEEAAGVLKHRKRKEKALRKLDAMQANLTRLTDLTGELRRQLKPLGRQAEIARRAQTIQSELRDARLRLAADNLVTLRDELAREEADEAQARARRAEVERQLSAARVEQEGLEAALAQDAPRLAAAQDTWYRLSALAERLRGTVRLAQERARHLADSTDRAPGRDPDELDAEADAIAEQEAELVDSVVEARRRLAEVTEERTETERRLVAAERAHLAAVRALADRRAGLATLAGRAAALRSGAAATAEEIERLSEALSEALDRLGTAESELATARDELGGQDDDTGRELERRYQQAAEAHGAAGRRVAELVARERAVEQQRAHWRARVEALSVGLARRDGSGVLLADGAPDGVLGALSGLIGVEPAARTAVAAALGDLAEAVVVASPESAVAALRLLRDRDAGRAALLIGGPADPAGSMADPAGPPAERAGPPVGPAGLLAERAGSSVVPAGPPADRAGPSVGSAGPLADRAGPSVGPAGPLPDRAGPPVGPAGPPADRAGPPAGPAAPPAGSPDPVDSYAPPDPGKITDSARKRRDLAVFAPNWRSCPVGADRDAAPPPSGRWIGELVTAPQPLVAALRRLLHGIVLVDDLAAARAVVDARPEHTAVTVHGDLLGAHRARGGSGAAGSQLDVQAEVDEAGAALTRVEQELAELSPALEGARAEEAARLAEKSAAQQQQGAAEQRRAAAAAQLGRLEQAVRSAEAEAARLRERRDAVETRRSDALLALEAAEQQLAVAEDEPVDDEPDTEVRDAAAEALDAARSEEVEARLALRTAEERARAIAGRADSLRRQAAAERQARARAAAARAARERSAAIAALVTTAGETACSRIAESLARASTERDAAAAARDARERALGEARAATARLSALMDKLTDAVHRDEMLRAENRLRAEQLAERVLAEHGLAPDDLITEYGPDVPVPAPAAEIAEYEAARERGEDVVAPPPMRYDRADQQRRAQRAEKDLTLLGRVNPLALEEFAALEERYTFLSTQLEDLKNTRRDLLTVVREVDEKILEVFADAYADVAREFGLVFQTLFPGGEGRLLLTDPDDLLTTGVEVEARPPGKKVKRLSLLSGGERSLTAIALLVAIFRARPSPFYILDEIEAALDDVNLRRLIGLLEELRATSQLIVITHQKPTMEVADALYGVSMRGDGITTVISQRLRPAS